MKKYSVAGILCGAAFGLASIVSVSATAGDYSETVISLQDEARETTAINYADLDLSKSEGVETLHRRISNAARRVCGSSNLRDAGSLRNAVANKACYHDAVAQGMSQIDSAQVASIAQ